MAVTRARAGFTLVEVLIVVVIMAILAAVIIPVYFESTKDAKESTLEFNLSLLRRYIEVYKLHHWGRPPSLVGGGLAQLTSATNRDGQMGPAGPSFPLGPYLYPSLPVNPLHGMNTVTETIVFPPAAASGNHGWLYHPATGGIAPDEEGYLDW